MSALPTIPRVAEEDVVKILSLLGLVVLAGDQSTPQLPQDVKEVSAIVSGLRTDSPAPEPTEAVQFLRLATACSAKHVTWVRGGRPIFRLEEDYLPRKAERFWRLYDVNSGWTMSLREKMEGFEFDSLAEASAGNFVQRFVRFQEEGREIRTEIQIEAGPAPPFSVNLTDEALLPGVLAAASDSGHQATWRNSAPSSLVSELRAWRSLECESNQGECPESSFYELVEALLTSESFDSGPAPSWVQVKVDRHRGLEAGIARLDFKPFLASECSGSAERRPDSARPH
jgi:hypothetical protein